MRAKLQSSRGFTLVEMLAATIIVSLLSLIIATGSQATLRAYTQIVTEAEASTLGGTLTELICDELRYATSVETDANGIVQQYISRQYGEKALLVTADGRLMVGAYPLLGEKAYTAGLHCDLTSLTFSQGVFNIQLSITDSGSPPVTRYQTEFAVAQLNP